MQDRPSGTLPRNLIINEIDDLGRALAPLIQPGSPIDRARRREVRALLRDAFLATQEDRAISELQQLMNRLRTLHKEFFASNDTGLTQRLGHRDEFGAVDEQLSRLGSFRTAVDRFTEMTDGIQERIERTLSSLSEEEFEESDRVRPGRYQPESTELITKKV